MSFFKKLFGGKVYNSNVEWNEHGQPVWPEDNEEYKNAVETEPVETYKDDVPDKPQQTRITGHDVLYIVPRDMKHIKVQVLHSNGKLRNEYTLTKYLSINGGDRIRLIVERK